MPSLPVWALRPSHGPKWNAFSICSSDNVERVYIHVRSAALAAGAARSRAYGYGGDGRIRRWWAMVSHLMEISAAASGKAAFQLIYIIALGSLHLECRL